MENLGDLIASASEDEEDCDNEENAISKYRDLLAGVGDVTEKPSEGDWRLLGMMKAEMRIKKS